MPSLSDLLSRPTVDELVGKFVNFLQLAGFPVASWHSGSMPKHFVETESRILNDLAASITNIAKAQFIRMSKDVSRAWCELCAKEYFDVDVKPAIATQGVVRLVDAGGVGPITKAPGTFWIANADRTRRYSNLEAFTIPLSGSVSTPFQAETAGVAWNIGNGAMTELITAEPGVTVDNPGLDDTGTWITRVGVDREDLDALTQRCIDKWSTLGIAANDAGYRYWATTPPEGATEGQIALWAEVTRVRVYSPYAGGVRVVLAGPDGPVSAEALAEVGLHIDTKRPTGLWDINTTNATTVPVAIGGRLRVRASYPQASVLAAAQTGIAAYLRTLDIGGGPLARVSREALIAAAMVDGVLDIEDFTPAADVALSANDIAVATFALTTQAA